MVVPFAKLDNIFSRMRKQTGFRPVPSHTTAGEPRRRSSCSAQAGISSGLTTERDNLLVIEAHAVEHLAQMVSGARLAIGPGRSSSCRSQPFMSRRSHGDLPYISRWPTGRRV